MKVDMAVIGGGLIGLAVAWEARERGMSIRVVEASSCARHASSASAGGVRSLNRHDAEIPLARAALPLWRELDQRLGRSVGFMPSGQMRLAEDEAGMAALEARATRLVQAGWTHEHVITAAELRRRIPSSASHCCGAAVVEDDGYADPLATVHAYRCACLDAGVVVTEGCAAHGVAGTGGGDLVIQTGQRDIVARTVVNCTGAWGGDLIAQEPVAMRAAALQMIVTAPVAPFATPVVGVHGRKLSLKQTGAGAVVIGGAFEADLRHANDCRMVRARLDPSRIGANLANAVAVFPHLAHARIVRAWSGVEGMMPDGLPVLGPSARLDGLFHAFGFSAHGFALAPLVGRMVAEAVDTGQADPLMAPFSVTRFAKPEARGRDGRSAESKGMMNDA